MILPARLAASRVFCARKDRVMNALCALAAALALVGSAEAAELKIVEIKAYAFLEHAGKLSDDLLSTGQALVDAPKGGALGGDTATGVLLDFTFEGDKNASPKYATAIVDLTQSGRSGRSVITHKAFSNFMFGPDGIEHKAVFLDAATCMPLAIEVHAGKTQKAAKIDFQCTEEPAPR
jgi:hypothetical protein